MFSLQKLTPISTQENFPQKENFVKRDLPTQLPSEKNFEVKNFQHLTMIFSENFQSLEIFLERKWAFTFKDVRCETRIHIKSSNVHWLKIFLWTSFRTVPHAGSEIFSTSLGYQDSKL